MGVVQRPLSLLIEPSGVNGAEVWTGRHGVEIVGGHLAQE